MSRQTLRTGSRTALAATWVLLLSTPGILRAQGSPPMFSTSLDLVYVFATVEGKDGTLVTDLSAQDFVVRDDGVARNIEAFGRAADHVATVPLELHGILLLDVSESMSANVRLSREAAVTFLDTVPSARELFVGLFDRQVRLRRYSPEARESMLSWLKESEPGGGTALYDSVALAADAFGPASGRQIIVLVTDGVDANSRIGLHDLLDRLESRGVTAYCVAFPPARPPRSPSEISPGYFDGRHEQVVRNAEEALRSIAKVTGGALFRASRAKDLDSIYGRILAELSSQYAIGFSASSTGRPGKVHKVEVEVKRPGLRVRHRMGYVTPTAGRQ
jgi:Ca-activated chloride channel homolog